MFRKLLINTLLIVSGSTSAIILAEVGYLLYLGTTQPLVTVTPMGEVLNPGGKGLYPTGGYVTLDENALRNGSDPEPSTRGKRILVIGDSLTFGTGVNDNETFVSLLNKRFRHQNIGFINTAVPGFNTDRLRSLLVTSLVKHGPIHGIIWVYNTNDARTSTSYLPVQYTDKSLVTYHKIINAYNKTGILEELDKLTWPYLKSMTFFTYLISLHQDNADAHVDWNTYFSICLDAYNPGNSTATLESNYLREITSWLKRDNIPLWFVLAPTVNQFTDRRTAPQDFVKTNLTGDAIPVLDLLDSFAAVENIERLYKEGDHGHWNATGHELAATKIADFLSISGLL